MYYQQMDDLGALGLGYEYEGMQRDGPPLPPGAAAPSKWQFGAEEFKTLQQTIQQGGQTYADLVKAQALARQRPPTQIVQYPGAGQMMPGYGPGYEAPPMATSTKWLLGIGAVLLVGAGVMYYTKRKKAGAPAASNPRDDDYNDGDDDGGGWKTIGA